MPGSRQRSTVASCHHRLETTMTSLRPLFGSLLLICVSLNVPLATAKDNSSLSASDRQEARREFCRQNPQKCEDLVKQAQERREDIKDYCAKNPAECEKKKAEFLEKREDRRQELEDYCAKNPKECEKKREEFRERLEQQQDSRN